MDESDFAEVVAVNNESFPLPSHCRGQWRSNERLHCSEHKVVSFLICIHMLLKHQSTKQVFALDFKLRGYAIDLATVDSNEVLSPLRLPKW